MMLGPLVEIPPVPSPPLNGLLVIDDDRSVQKVLRRLFESVGCAVRTASDGRGGLREFEENQPGTVILDLRLPDMPGQDVCRTMKLKAPRLPVVIVSAVRTRSIKSCYSRLGLTITSPNPSVRGNCWHARVWPGERTHAQLARKFFRLATWWWIFPRWR